jgi:hypothetical protein
MTAMPDRDVKTIRDLIYYQSPKIILPGVCGAIIVQNRENGRFFVAFSRLCWQKRELSV